MKIVFGILASYGENYDKFKELWIKNISRFNKEDINFYFIYNEKVDKDINILDFCDNYIVEMENSHYNFYYKYDEKMTLMDSMLYRSISLMEYIKTKNIECDLFIRTNLSTLFDLNAFLTWSNMIPKTKLFAGTVIDKFNSIYTCISGTNMIFTRDIVEFLVSNKDFILSEKEVHGDDQRISNIIIENLDVCVLLVKRFDLIELIYKEIHYPKSIVLQSCDDLRNVFCYRFKTLNRETDIQNMIYFSDLINKNGKISLNDEIERLKNIGYNGPYLQNREYDLYTHKCFKIVVTNETLSHYTHYNTQNMKFPSGLNKKL